MAASIWQNAGLIGTLIAREVVGRYRGSMLGLLWSFFNPIFMLGVYTFVFSVVFKARWGTQGTGSQSEYALTLFVGLIAFNLFAECVSRAPGLVLANANYVKKVVFPLEVLPVVNLGAAAFHAVVSLGVWMIFFVVLSGVPHWTSLWVPVTLVPLALWVLGISWALASLGVYLRDVGQVVGLAMTSLMFLSPVFYPASALPERLRPIFELNPLTSIIEMMREALMAGRRPSMSQVAVQCGVGFIVASLGFAWFQKTRRGFADVL